MRVHFWQTLGLYPAGGAYQLAPGNVRGKNDHHNATNNSPPRPDQASRPRRRPVPRPPPPVIRDARLYLRDADRSPVPIRRRPPRCPVRALNDPVTSRLFAAAAAATMMRAPCCVVVAVAAAVFVQAASAYVVPTGKSLSTGACKVTLYVNLCHLLCADCGDDEHRCC